MLNRIIEFSLRNRMLVMIAGVVLLVAGTYTARKMEVDVFPDLNAPTVVVMTEASGMAAEEVERTVTFPIETAVNGATDVRRVRFRTRPPASRSYGSSSTGEPTSTWPARSYPKSWLR